MDVDLKSKVDIFKEYYNEINKALIFDNNKVKIVESLLYIINKNELDKRELKDIRKYISKSELKILFNGNVKKVISAFLCSNFQYKKIIKDTVIIYDSLVNKGFKKDKYLELLSFIITLRFPEEEYDTILNNMLKIKSEIKNKIQGIDEFKLINICFINLSMFCREYDHLVKKYLKIYFKLLKQSFNKEESFYIAIAMINLEEKDYTSYINKIIEAKELLNNTKIEMKEEHYLLLGLGSLIIENNDEFVDNIFDVYSSLCEKRFVKKDQIVIVSITLVLYEYIEIISEEDKELFIQNEINIVKKLIEYLTVLLI
ncbi:DUF4003 family protein [Clostridium taeniosporum]|uniref:DUF4003 domain-containing protein n=1 Tax=Clostridium taeniosporum TaxID=394958 RepID=A0A1D7XIL0_9CLOT|nr:DUF4003 family protein [Clostridium taeniosporum]AOR23177.1 DUF4003 domain-containing protein [Clostridium taeniosporum]